MKEEKEEEEESPCYKSMDKSAICSIKRDPSLLYTIEEVRYSEFRNTILHTFASVYKQHVAF